MQTGVDARAHRLGTFLGSLAWEATVAVARLIVVALRVTLVVTVLALIWHAIVPGMAFGAWAVIFLASYALPWPRRRFGR